MKKIYLIYIVGLLLWACHQKPENIISRTTYKQVLKELILADLIQQKIPDNDSLNNNIILLVYKKYKIDSAMLKKTTDYYSYHPEELSKIYDEIYTEFKHKADSLNKIEPHLQPKTDEIKINNNFLHFKKKKN